MGQKTKKGKGRLDKFYYLAKEQGYRSRAAFKLIQLNKKYDILGNCKALMDLCAAPGGWLQVASKTMPLTSLIIGVDLVPIKPIRGVKTIVHDITTQACRTALKKEAKGSKFEVVLHDGAPNVGGAWSNEAYTQSALVLDSLRLATEFLAPAGCFVTKVFRSKDYNALLYAFNQLFDKVDSTKPTASRNTSAEIFVVCQGYKAPAKIDPRLLDPKHLFQEVSDAPRIMGPEALLRDKIKQKRHREGYEDGLSSSHKAASAVAFISSESPVEMLGQFTRLTLDGADSWKPVEGVENIKEMAELIRSHASTTAEIRTLCADLQVLGRSEFKQLLRWRLQLKKFMAMELGDAGGTAAAKKTTAAKGKDGTDAVEEGDPEEALLAEMAAIKERMESRLKREKKHRREMKKKAKIRALQMVSGSGILTEEQQDGLFSLNVIKGGGKAEGGARAVLARVTEVSAPGEDDMAALEADSDSEGASGDNESDLDSNDEDLRYEAELEEALEDSYSEYLARRGKREELVKEKRKRLGMDGELDEDGDEDGDEDEDDASDRLDDEDEGNEETGGGLLVSLDEGRAGVAKSGAAMAAQWFKQDVFAGADMEDDDDEEDEDVGLTQPLAKKPKQDHKSVKTFLDDDDDEEEGDEIERMAAAAALRATVGSAGGTTSGTGDGFEVVPLTKDKKAAGSESDSEDEFDMLDDQGKAEVLALAKRMLRRKEKESIIDAAYNRYSSHDVGLPRWFEEDEAKHRRPIMPVTKEEVAAEKARLKSIDSRPIKKVAEAKARKRMKLHARLTSAREKAEAIADQEDVPMKSKMKEIEKLYARAKSGGKGKKGGKDGKRKGPPVDGRLRQDLKSQKRQALKKGKGKGRGKGKGKR